MGGINKGNMKVSVIIPVHQANLKYFEETVKSVINQTIKPQEIIIIDDGSDPPLEFALPDGGDMIRVIKNKKNMGVSYSWNRGIKETKGDVICLLGSDDLWMPKKLEKQIKMAKKYPDYILHGNAVEIDENGKEIYRTTLQDYTLKEYKERAKQPYGWYYTCSFWIPKEMFDKVGLFNESIKYSEDYEWILRAILLHNVKFKLMKDVLMKKRRNLDSLTYKNKDNMFEHAEEIRKSIMEKIK